MYRYYVALLLVLIACRPSVVSKPAPEPEEPFKPLGLNFEERPGVDSLAEYLERHPALEPRIIINNTPPYRDRFEIGGHRVELGTQSRTIRIDGKRIDLGNGVLLNSGDTIQGGYEWLQAKLYELDGHNLIGLSLELWPPPNGRNLGHRLYLAYDLNKKTENWWEGTGGGEFNLYAFREGSLDFLFEDGDEPYPKPGGDDEPFWESRYELYSFVAGRFIRQKSPGGRPYFIRRTESLREVTSFKPLTESHWFEVIR